MPLSPVSKGKPIKTVKTKKRAVGLPFRFAAIDLGSNSIKARITEIRSGSSHHTLWEKKYPVRLGHETFMTGKLSREMIQKAVDALQLIKSVSRKYRVYEISAVATSAVREASNRQQLIQKIITKTKIPVEIISGTEEARLIAMGVLGEKPESDQDYLIMDIGGGSAEVIFSNDVTIIDTQSLPLGAVRIKELYVKTDPIHSDEFALLRDHIRSVIQTNLRIVHIPEKIPAYGCAGTIHSLVDIAKGYHNNRKSKKTISLPQINNLIIQFKKLDFHQRMKKFKLEKRRAEIILPGAMVLSELMNTLNIRSIELSNGGVRDGLLYDFLERNKLVDDTAFDHDQAYLKSLFDLVKRYGTDLRHVVQVSSLAMRIFELLKDLHHYSAAEKNILKGAALLHDIGHYISYSKHHKHTYYLIIHSDIPGITEREKLLIATVARYHRRAFPNMKQDEYRILNQEERVLVRKLAGILRIADALDREHQSLVSTVDCHINNRKIDFHIIPSRHIPVELWAAEKKAKLFELAFHTKTSFQEQLEF